ncbi:glycosyltransferase [Hymenobacter cavernae]|uniref:Glycosyltransferase 2-like domain-containing protein n=1 Tax=Hymenobacter cavernae TaxID=2044852 RepID=A0ABQ1UJW3_9BACT|nr:glycosyltransferase [Hymenobacter cavernae]GGF20498.1 hypothetical protein GCM10011383_35180 [Hymenobacter cavernae]
MIHARPAGVSVLICTYNGAQRLTPTLEHLARQQVAAGTAWEVILVDNGSTDNSLALGMACWNHNGSPVPLRTFLQPVPGKNNALELAYQEAAYEYMCIVDDDNWLEDNYLQSGFDLLSRQDTIGVLGGSNKGAFEVPPPAWFARVSRIYAVGEPLVFTGTPPQQLTTLGKITQGTPWGAGLFIRHAAWRLLKEANFESLFTGRIGEKQLSAGEDDELCYAVRLIGYELWYEPALRLTHFMTKGRLTTDYVPRIIHSFSQTYSRLSAYRRLVYTPDIDYSKNMSWVKDFAYITLRTFSIKNLVKYIKLRMKGDIEYLLEGQQFYTWFNFIVDYRETRSNYLKVKSMQERARLLSKTSLSNKVADL